MKRIKAVTAKEFLHILRDPRSLLIVFILPVVMIFVLGYSLSFDLENIQTGLIDYSQSDLSRRLANKFSQNNIYQVKDLTHPQAQKDGVTHAEELLRSGKIKQYIMIPPDFSQRMKRNQVSFIGAVIDGSDSNIANIIHQYNQRVVQEFIQENTRFRDILDIHTKLFFNPENKSTFFIVPGLAAVIMIMITALLTSLSVSREKETGSIELLFISPLKSAQIIIGKTAPYVVVALLEGMIIVLFGRFWFHIPIKGNLLILLFFALLYIITGLSMGITISTIASTQKVAMMVSLLATLLPSILISGFLFPLESLTPILRAVSYVVPATYFLEIIRGIVLKGASWSDFITEGLALMGFCILFLAVATRKFNQERKVKK